MDPDGSDLKELLPDWTYTITVPRWSWQGNLLLAQAGTAFSPTILPADAQHHIHVVPDTAMRLLCSAWSPDATTLACEGRDAAKPSLDGLYSIASQTAALQPFAGEQVAVGAPARLTTPPKGVRDIPGDAAADGRIAFVRTTYSVLGLGEIWMVAADGSNAYKLTDTLSTYRIGWSRDGRWIVGERDGAIEVIDLQDLTADPQRIELAGGAATEPRFSPDGTRIVFVFQKTGSKTTSIATVKLDGTDVVKLTSGELDRSPDWGAPGF